MTNDFRSFGYSLAGYVVSAFGLISLLYGHVSPFRHYSVLIGPIAQLDPMLCLAMIPLGLTVAAASAWADARRRATWWIHRIDYFFALVGALVTTSLTEGLLEWGQSAPAVHVLAWGGLFTLGSYCWETTVVRLRAKTLATTTSWRRVFATLPVRRFSGGFILAAVAVSTGALLLGARTALSGAIDRTDYSHVAFTYWLVNDWFAPEVLPAVVLAVIAILGLNIVSVTASQQQAIEAKLREERFRAELVTNVTHDLRTPLTSIISYADLIGRYPATDPTLSEYSAVLGRQADRLRVLIGDVLDASRVSAGAVNVQLGPIALTEIVGQVAGDFDAAFTDRGLTWVSTPSAPCVVSADGALLWRVLENLVGNVVKHARPCTEVQVEVLTIGQQGVLRVSNQLESPLTVDANTLTQQFVRGDESRHQSGGGLGLFIADRLVHAMGAELSLDSAGTTFTATVRLPLSTQWASPTAAYQLGAVRPG